LPPNRKLLWSPNLSAASKVEEHFGVSGTWVFREKEFLKKRRRNDWGVDFILLKK
jgi:hypothetical protein